MPSPAENAATVREAHRDVVASLIAVKGHLDTPYPDDPRWTPWTRFVERSLKRLDESKQEITALLAQAEAGAGAQREADIQLGEKLAAQMTLKAVCDALDLPMVSLGNGWTEATPKILARIEEIVDEANRLAAERDAAVRERDRARDALRQIAEYTSEGNVTDVRYGRFAVGQMVRIARAALTGEGTDA